jgi:hypothetical protein
MKPSRIAAMIGALVLHAGGIMAVAEEKAPRVKQGPPLAYPSATSRTLMDVAEVEPNGSPAQAQAIGCGGALRPAALLNVAAVPDTDWISFEASEGDIITFETNVDPPGQPETDTVIDLYDSDGARLATNDDIGKGTVLSRIRDFRAPYSGIYYGRIRGFRSGKTPEGPYRADVICSSPPPVPDNDQCAGAIELAEGTVALSGNNRSAADDYNVCPGEPTCPTTCTGFPTPGRDVVYRLNVPSAGDVIDVTYAIDPNLSDASLYIVTDCANIAGTCVAGQDSQDPMVPERLTYVFPSAGTYYLILDTFEPAGGSWTLSGCMRCTTPTRSVTWGKLKSIYR